MGELKDWTGDDMTQWTEYRVNMAEELEQRCIDRWDELWKFNDGLEPKFWFGDRVKIQGREATIVGMQWRSEERASIVVPLLQGWVYSVIFYPEGGSSWFHETSVKAIDTGEEQCQGF